MANQVHKTLSNQGDLEAVLSKLFPGEKTLTNARKESLIKNPHTGWFLELDVWFPSLRLCFEFQDPYHYITTWDSHRSVDEIKQKDSSKSESVIKRGLTLVVVPCWWSGDEGSLAESIKFARPDLLTDYQPTKNDENENDIEDKDDENNEDETLESMPIALNPTKDFFTLVGDIPDVGELMLASFPVSIKFKSSISKDNPWWMGEKYDGMRTCWNPIRKALYSRAGREIPVHRLFYPRFPARFLDGELWFGRSYFQDTQKFSNEEFHTLDWGTLRFVCFDEPTITFASIVEFEKRYEKMLSYFKYNHPFLLNAPRVLLESRQHLKKSIQDIISEGGEGVILRKPLSVYVHGRSSHLIKLKASRGDREGLVVVDNKNNPDGDVELLLPDGITFSLPSTLPLLRGDIVTFTYENYSRYAIPIKPRVVRIRKDVSWQEVVKTYEEQVNHEKELGEASLRLSNIVKQKPFGFWVEAKGKNARAFFEKFAKSRNLDPLKADSWYRAGARKTILGLKESRSVLQNYKGSVVKALVHLFEEVGFDKQQFQHVPKKHWQDSGNMRRFFISFADHHGFDPLVPTNWYNIMPEVILERKGGSSVLGAFKGSYSKALTSLFPEIGFDASKFKVVPRSHWMNMKSKLFFDNFARQYNFNPLIASNWYSVRHEDVVAQKGGNTALSLFKGSLSVALSRIYPDIGIIKSKFKHLTKGVKFRFESNKKFFIDFARSSGFDPFIAENWYNIPRKRMLEVKGAEVMIRNYKGSFIRALLTLFPNIGLDGYKFVYRYRDYWTEKENRRRFFVDFAKSQGFDPLIAENWYPIPRDKITAVRGASNCMSYYQSYVHALLDLFPEIGLNESKFVFPRIYYWRSSENRRNLFIEFAKSNNFDPYDVANWYKLTMDDLYVSSRMKTVVGYYDGSLSSAVIALFPELVFDEAKFVIKKIGKHTIQSRRRFFETIAETNEFDPLVPENWYSKEMTVLNAQGIGNILSHYQMSLPKAITHLFPEIELDESKFSQPPKASKRSYQKRNP